MKANSSKTVFLDSKELETMAYELKRKRVDYYLFFELVYKTGVTGFPLLKMTVSDIKQFCEDYAEFLPDDLLRNINEHMNGKSDSDYFFNAKLRPSCKLSKRTVENVLSTIGNEFGYPDFSVKNLYKTFFYEQFRACGYSYEDFKPFLRERNRYIADLPAFLDYCGLTMEDYEQDIAKHMTDKNVLIKELDELTNFFEVIKEKLSNNEIAGEEYRKISSLITQVAVLVNHSSK